MVQSTGMTLEEVNAEFEYGTGHVFHPPLCTELNTGCRYQIRIKEPVLAYAPQAMGGYRFESLGQ